MKFGENVSNTLQDIVLTMFRKAHTDARTNRAQKYASGPTTFGRGIKILCILLAGGHTHNTHHAWLCHWLQQTILNMHKYWFQWYMFWPRHYSTNHNGHEIQHIKREIPSTMMHSTSSLYALCSYCYVKIYTVKCVLFTAKCIKWPGSLTAPS